MFPKLENKHSVVIFQKLRVPQLVKQVFFFLNGNWSFTIMLAIACCLLLSGARWIQSVPIHSTLLLSSQLHTVFQAVAIIHVSPPKSCRHFYSPPYVLHAPPIPSFLIWLLEQYLVRSKIHEVSHYAIFSNFLLLLPFRLKYLLKHLQQTHSDYSL